MNKKIPALFFRMMKIGLFTFGGGYAMISLLQNEFVEKEPVLKKEEFLDMVAIAESTPGPIAINAATYIGYAQGGVLGSIAATVGVCIPSLVIIYLISLFFEAFLSLTLVAKAFAGIRVCVAVLIINAGINLLKGLNKDVPTFVILTVCALALFLLPLFGLSVSPVVFILASGLIGWIIYRIRLWKGGDRQ